MTEFDDELSRFEDVIPNAAVLTGFTREELYEIINSEAFRTAYATPLTSQRSDESEESDLTPASPTAWGTPAAS